jgi:protein-S-isoprenylcysteine O-methyltransferase Ste14
MRLPNSTLDTLLYDIVNDFVYDIAMLLAIGWLVRFFMRNLLSVCKYLFQTLGVPSASVDVCDTADILR